MTESTVSEAPETFLPQAVRDIEARAGKLGLNMTALCARAEVSRSTWTRIKNGTHLPTLRTLQKFQAVLDAAEQEGAAA